MGKIEIKIKNCGDNLYLTLTDLIQQIYQIEIKKPLEIIEYFI